MLMNAIWNGCSEMSRVFEVVKVFGNVICLGTQSLTLYMPDAITMGLPLGIHFDFVKEKHIYASRRI